MCGGFTGNNPITDDLKQLANKLRPKVEQALGKTYSVYEPVSFKSQVVAGTNYKIKVKVDGEKYVHMVVFVPLPHTGNEPNLSSQTEGHSLEDAL